MYHNHILKRLYPQSLPTCTCSGQIADGSAMAEGVPVMDLDNLEQPAAAQVQVCTAEDVRLVGKEPEVHSTEHAGMNLYLSGMGSSGMLILNYSDNTTMEEGISYISVRS